MLTNDEMCMSRRSFQIWSASQFMPWGAIRGCFSGARKFCVPFKALTNLFGQLAVSYLVLALERFAMSRISLTRGRHWRIKYQVFYRSMKIYLGFTVAGSRSSIEAAKRILTVLQSLGHEVLTSHLVSDDAWRADRSVAPQKIFARDMNWLAECDLFVAEVTGSSFGLGFETGYLLGATAKKTILCFERDAEHRISLLITGNTHPNCVLAPYSNLGELEESIRRYVSPLELAPRSELT
jgi:2'-deoxynucleoside 5'-phosphate N-hydrolase